jgi:lipoyl-dependent peroxiredoxin
MQTLEKTLYTAHATALGGRDGHVKSDDGIIDMKVTPPKAMGGPGGATNPEQLFAAGYSACFGSAVAHVARMQKLTTGPVAITANVSIGPVGRAYGLAVELHAAIPELPRDVAQKLLEDAHQVCPYSNATRGNIAVTLSLA